MKELNNEELTNISGGGRNTLQKAYYWFCYAVGAVVAAYEMEPADPQYKDEVPLENKV